MSETRTQAALWTALLVGFVLLFPGVSQAREKGHTRWKMATLAPDRVGWAKYIKEIVFPVIEEASQGQVSIKVYWGGIMGDDEVVLGKMKKGILQGGGFTGQGAHLACREFSVLELPFLFSDYKEVDHIKKKMESRFQKLLEKNGYYFMAWLDQDFDQVYSSNYPMVTRRDFAESRFLAWYGPVEDATLASLHARIVPVDVPDINESIRLDKGDAAIGPAMWVVGAQLQPFIKYINPVKIRYAPAPILCTMDAWQALPSHFRKRYLEMKGPVMAQYTQKVRQDNARTLEALYKYGLKKSTMPPAELEFIKARTRTVWHELSGKMYPKEILDEILTHLEAFQKAQ